MVLKIEFGDIRKKRDYDLLLDKRLEMSKFDSKLNDAQLQLFFIAMCPIWKLNEGYRPDFWGLNQKGKNLSLSVNFDN